MRHHAKKWPVAMNTRTSPTCVDTRSWGKLQGSQSCAVQEKEKGRHTIVGPDQHHAKLNPLTWSRKDLPLSQPRTPASLRLKHLLHPAARHNCSLLQSAHYPEIQHAIA